MSSLKQFFWATTTLTGTIIGAGFFVLPYIASRVGLPLMFGYFLIIGSLVILIHLLFAEVALKTPDFLRLPGFAKVHLGQTGQKIAGTVLIIGGFGTILVYLLLGGNFLAQIFQPTLGNSQIFYTLLYFALASTFIYLGIRPIARIDLNDLMAFSVVLLIILFFGTRFFRLENLLPASTPLDFKNLFLPFGPLLFALWGATMIPEIEELLGENKQKLLKKVVFTSLTVSLVFYFFFTILVLGISGPTTTPDAFAGLSSILKNQFVINLGLVLGVITIFTSYLAVGLTLEKTFRYDLGLSKNQAFWLISALPLILFLTGLGNFIKIIGFVGGFMLGLEGILILLMYRKLYPKKSWVYPLIVVFLLGMGYQIIFMPFVF
jgi:amino acid permease